MMYISKLQQCLTMYAPCVPSTVWMFLVAAMADIATPGLQHLLVLCTVQTSLS